MAELSLAELIEKIRRGDSEAVRIFMLEYQGAVEREVRFALLDRRLRRVVSESDVKQSVMMRFVVGLWAGKYEFSDPQQVAGLLKAMVRARVVDLVRHWNAEKRDLRKNAPLSDPGVLAARKSQPTPSEMLAHNEILHEIDTRLNEEERSILRLRQDGRSWHDLAVLLGTKRSPEALRKQHERALARISRELGLHDD